jgi:predicted DNA-binding transcriptional regulator AlpA
MTDLADLPPRLTPRELAGFWRVSLRTIERRVAADRAPQPIRTGGRLLFRREDVLAWEEEHQKGSEG